MGNNPSNDLHIQSAAWGYRNAANYKRHANFQGWKNKQWNNAMCDPNGCGSGFPVLVDENYYGAKDMVFTATDGTAWARLRDYNENMSHLRTKKVKFTKSNVNSVYFVCLDPFQESACGFVRLCTNSKASCAYEPTMQCGGHHEGVPNMGICNANRRLQESDDTMCVSHTFKEDWIHVITGGKCDNPELPGIDCENWTWKGEDDEGFWESQVGIDYEGDAPVTEYSVWIRPSNGGECGSDEHVITPMPLLDQH